MSETNPYAPQKHVELSAAAVAPEKENSAPTGTVPELLDWVDGDKDKAATVLKAEKSNEHPRKSLVAALENLLEEK